LKYWKLERTFLKKLLRLRVKLSLFYLPVTELRIIAATFILANFLYLSSKDDFYRNIFVDLKKILLFLFLFQKKIKLFSKKYLSNEKLRDDSCFFRCANDDERTFLYFIRRLERQGVKNAYWRIGATPELRGARSFRGALLRHQEGGGPPGPPLSPPRIRPIPPFFRITVLVFIIYYKRNVIKNTLAFVKLRFWILVKFSHQSMWGNLWTKTNSAGGSKPDDFPNRNSQWQWDMLNMGRVSWNTKTRKCNVGNDFL